MMCSSKLALVQSLINYKKLPNVKAKSLNTREGAYL